MKEKRILDALNDVKDEYVEEVVIEEIKSSPKPRKMWIRWVGMAASIVLVVYAGLYLSKDLNPDCSHEEPENPSVEDGDTTDLDISISDLDAGFGVVTTGQNIISIEKERLLLTKNPWMTDMETLAYPVYKNLAYVSAAGAPAYFSEEELLAKAEDVAIELRTSLTEWQYFYIPEAKVESFGDAYQITAQTEVAEITVLGNGSITIDFYEAVEMPTEYTLSNDKKIEEAEATVNDLLETYQEVIGENDYTADCSVSYDLLGNRTIHYNAFASAETGNPIAEYCFQQVQFYADEEGRLTLIRFGDVRTAAEYIGDYGIITEEEARTHLEAGDYVSILTEADALGGNFSDENIAKVELTYLTGSTCQYFQPYYCFYIEIETETDGIANYCSFFVPALCQEDLADFPETNPLGN